MITWNRFFFNSPNSYLIETILILHDYVMLFIFSILFLVLSLIVCTFYFKFHSINFFENHELEIIWTIIPFIILVFLLSPSLRSLYILDACSFCGLTVSIIGHQWYWSYMFKDFFEARFDSYMLPVDSRFIRLLDVDNRLLIPTLLPVRFMVSSVDVIHSWALPSFGVKIDAVPGRVNQFCFSRKRSGIYFGQCSEICGANHRFIPIVLESIPFKNFLGLI